MFKDSIYVTVLGEKYKYMNNRVKTMHTPAQFLIIVLCALLSCQSITAKSTEKQREHYRSEWKSKVHGGAKRVHAANEQPNLEEAVPKSFNNAAVAADHGMCSTMGKEILQKGGTSADALVTTHCCVEIVNSHSTGLGGGGFIVYYDRESKTSKAYDFRETLPSNYQETTNQTQGDTVLVPGILKGLHKVWKDFGKLPWKTLWKPCIDLAHKGFQIHVSLSNAIEAKQDYIMKNENLRLLFAPNGQLLRKGETLKRPALAETFSKIANSGGSDIFYKGEIAKTIVQNIADAGGSMTLEDLSNYKVMVREPLKSTVRGLQMLSTPPPGSGALISLAVKIMSHFNWTPSKQYDNRGLLYHRMIEAFKFAYAPFSFLGDPNHTNHTEEVCKYMLDSDVAKNMYERIDNSSHKVEYYQPYNKLKQITKTGTTHISLVDKEGSGCACTTSINAYFGSKYRSKELGFIYNNELADFSEFWQRVYNLTADRKLPGKKPMSKASPTIFVDKNDDVVGVFGAAGGFFIPTALTQSIVNWLFFRNNIKVAVSKPRIHCQLFPPTVVYEPTFPQELLKPIESYGHEYVTNSTYDVSGQLNAIMGVVQAVVRLPSNEGKPGKLHAECDYRKGGTPDGF